MLASILEALAAASLVVSLVQVYLIVSKVWGRKHDRVVAESQSTVSNLLGLITGAPWVLTYGLDGEIKLALVSALWLGLTVFFTLVGLGVWVPETGQQGLWGRLRAALRLERQEAGELLKSVFRPQDAALVLRILRQIAHIDRHIDPRERRFIEDFAESWGIPSPFDEAAGAQGHEGFVALRASVVDYLALEPPREQVLQLREVVVALVSVDDEVSDEEALVQGEITGLLDAHVRKGGEPGVHRVMIVPQSGEQDQAIRGLLRGAEPVAFRGGQAYVAGRFYSTEYAGMMVEKYRSLGFFSVLSLQG